jgi:carbon storage regulator
MLVLSRKIGESIQIAGGIRVTVTEVRGGRVRLSIEAPADVRVLRKEIVAAGAELPEPKLAEPGLPSETDL